MLYELYHGHLPFTYDGDDRVLFEFIQAAEINYCDHTPPDLLHFLQVQNISL